MQDAKEIIDEQRIRDILEKTKNPSHDRILGILGRALKKKGLTLEEAGCLLSTKDKGLTERMFRAAARVKKEIYGERLVFFAPLYISSFCVNDCEYCGFHRRNKAERRKLTIEEVRKQVRILEDMGHKRLLLEFGEHPGENPISYVVDVIRAIYSTRSGRGEIRRVNVNIAATTVDNYRKLKSAGIGTYQLFQETYHRETYERMHNGPKSDYERQLFAHDRAFEAGIDDVGLGVLFGLYDHRFEVLALLAHAEHLNRKFGVGPHTFSVPRWQPADTVDIPLQYKVSEDDMLRIIAILRLSVPYTGMIISTRESREMREKSFEIGISQASAASRASPGGYGSKDSLSQFCLSDNRNVDDVLRGIVEQGLIPSFCTACYRKGRTGESFMSLAKPGKIQDLCTPNAILTFREYIEDYASPQVKETGMRIICRQMEQLPDDEIKKETKARLKRIEEGERDLYF